MPLNLDDRSGSSYPPFLPPILNSVGHSVIPPLSCASRLQTLKTITLGIYSPAPNSVTVLGVLFGRSSMTRRPQLSRFAFTLIFVASLAMAQEPSLAEQAA